MTKETKPAAARIYVCHDRTTGDVKYVRATNPAQAIGAWLRNRIAVRVAKPEDVMGVSKSELLDATATEPHPDQQPLDGVPPA